MKGEGELKRKAIMRQRKDTICKVIRPMHPDCNEAFRKLIDKNMEIVPIANDSVDHEYEDNDVNSELSSIIDD